MEIVDNEVSAVFIDKLCDGLPSPCFSSLRDAVTTCWSHLCAGKYEESIRWSRIVQEFTWEQLNSGKWSEVKPAWKELYTLLSLLESTALSSLGRAGDALTVLDKGLLLGAPTLFGSKLHAYASTLVSQVHPSELQVKKDSASSQVHQTDLQSGDGSPCTLDSTQIHPSEGSFSSPCVKKRRILFKNYSQYKDTDSKPCNATRSAAANFEPVLSKGDDAAFVLSTLLSEDSIRVPVLCCPSLETFRRDHMSISSPVVLTGCMDYWPAYSEKKWSLEYLKLIAGPRTVPIELGSQYTDRNWSQKLMTLSEFIDGYVIANPKVDAASPRGYLAQHQLFDQVVGRKRIRLYGKEQTKHLYPHQGLLTNTSQVDIEAPDLEQFPDFANAVCSECVLYPGQMLYIPPLCWHHVRSLDTSFSVSFWWS